MPSTNQKSGKGRLRGERIVLVVGNSLSADYDRGFPASRVEEAPANACGIAIGDISDAAVDGAELAAGRIKNAAVYAGVLAAGRVDPAAGDSRPKATDCVQFTGYDATESRLCEPITAADDQVM